MKVRGLLSTLGVAFLAAASGCGRKGVESSAKASTAADAVTTVKVAPLEHRLVERTVAVVGSLKGWEDVTIGAKKVGRVVRVHHDMGDRVKPGELLVELDPVDAELEVRRAERQLEAELAKLGLKEVPRGDFNVETVPAVVRSKVALERAVTNLNRERALSRKGSGTAQDLQNADNDARGAEAALADAILAANATLASARASQAAVDIARQARQDCEIRAPVPSKLPQGVTHELTYALARRSVAEGEMLKQGDPVDELVIEDPLRLWANVPEKFASEIELGQEVRILVGSYPDITFHGKVARINPSVDHASRTFQVEIAVPNNRGLLRPGGFAKASILTTTSARAAIAPLESIVKFAGVTKLFVVEGGKARSINVETGIEGKDWVEVIGKLPETAMVVTTGHRQLADGKAVAIQKTDAPEAEVPRTASTKPSK